MGEERLQLAGEDEPPPVAPPVQRLLPQSVPTEQQHLPACVPDCEGEHAVEATGEVDGRMRLGEVGEGLRVTGGGERVPLRRQVGPHLRVVVDLTVEDGAYLSGLVAHRRVAGYEVDDRESGLADDRLLVGEHALGIRPAMTEVCQHPTDRGLVGTGDIDAPGDPAHSGAPGRAHALRTIPALPCPQAKAPSTRPPTSPSSWDRH